MVGASLYGSFSPYLYTLKDYDCSSFVVPSQPDKFGIIDHRTNKLGIYHFKNFRPERELELPDINRAENVHLSFDGSLLAFTTREDYQNFLYLINFETGKTQLKQSISGEMSPVPTYLIGGWLYASTGYKMDISNLLQ